MAARLFRTDVQWTICGGLERATIGLWQLNPLGDHDVDGMATLMGPVIQDWWLAQRSLHHPSVDLVGARVNQVTISNGHTTAGSDAPITPSAGSQTGTSLPAEAALVVSLRTPFSGAKFRGRVYLPPMNVDNLDSVGNVLTAAYEACADNMAAMLAAVDTSSGGTVHPVVYSRADRATTTITQVRCGAVMDVHRSRRRSLVEHYYSVAV